MTVVVDTSVLVGAVNLDDRQHEAASGLMKRIVTGEFGRPVTSEYVLDEGLTLLRRRSGHRSVAEDYASYFFGDDVDPPPLRVVLSVWEDLVAAYSLHQQHFDRGLSFTDCILAGLADSLQAPIASLDRGFDGIVPRVAPE